MTKSGRRRRQPLRGEPGTRPHGPQSGSPASRHDSGNCGPARRRRRARAPRTSSRARARRSATRRGPGCAEGAGRARGRVRVPAVERSGLRPRRHAGVCVTQSRRHFCAHIRVTRHTPQRSGRFEVKNVASRILPSEGGPEVGRCPSPTPGSSCGVLGPGPGLLLSGGCPIPRSRFALAAGTGGGGATLARGFRVSLEERGRAGRER